MFHIFSRDLSSLFIRNAEQSCVNLIWLNVSHDMRWHMWQVPPPECLVLRTEPDMCPPVSLGQWPQVSRLQTSDNSGTCDIIDIVYWPPPPNMRPWHWQSSASPPSSLVACHMFLEQKCSFKKFLRDSSWTLFHARWNQTRAFMGCLLYNCWAILKITFLFHIHVSCHRLVSFSLSGVWRKLNAPQLMKYLHRVYFSLSLVYFPFSLLKFFRHQTGT